MASEFPTSGDKLRKLINKSRAFPISFGFNPGTSETGDEYFAAHSRKTPELLGKLALTEGAGTKSAFGTFIIDASELHLTCFRTLPQLAKKVKKYLKENKITLNVVIFDPDGNVMDSDVEVLEGWEASLAELDEDAASGGGDKPSDIHIPPAFRTAPEPKAAKRAEDVSVPPGFETEPDPEPEPETSDPGNAAMAVLAERLRAVQARAALLPPAIAKRLDGALRAAAVPLRDGDAEAAAKVIGRIEATVAGIPDPARTDPKVVAALASLTGAVNDLDGVAGDKLRVLLERTQGQIEAGQTDAALKGLRTAGRAFQAVRAAEMRWVKAAPMVGPLAEQAANAGATPVARAWDTAREAAEDGDWPAALAALPRVIAALRAVAA